MSRRGDLVAFARFSAGLYAVRLGRGYRGYLGRDPMARLGMRPGREDPYPVYEEIRKGGRVVPTSLGNLATVDYEVASSVLRSRRYGVRPENEVPGEQDDFDLSFLDRNPPDHTRLRRLAAPAFSPKRMAGYRPRVEALVADLVDRGRSRGHFDLVADLAAPLPIAVITDLLGIPDVDAPAFSRYGAVIGSGLEGVRSVGHARALMRANAELERIFTDLFERRRHDPRDDIVSDLVAQGPDRILPAELLPLCALLLIAGFETTVNLVGNAVVALLGHPHQWLRLVDDPGLAGGAVEEVLRYDPPVQRTARVAFDVGELGGVPVQPGQLVNVLIGGANRDPWAFPDPGRFDITRRPEREHLAFSAGIHYCLGQPLARLEAGVVLQTLAERLPGLRHDGRLVRRRATLIRGPLRLPVSA